MKDKLTRPSRSAKVRQLYPENRTKNIYECFAKYMESGIEVTDLSEPGGMVLYAAEDG